MKVRDLIKDDAPSIFTQPASPDDKQDFKHQSPETDPQWVNRIGGDKHKQAMKQFGKQLKMMQDTANMLKSLDVLDPDMQKRLDDLIAVGIKQGFLKSL